MKTPMPSPNGTNFERRFLKTSAKAAYDEKPSEGQSGGHIGFMKRLAAKCSPEEWAELHGLLGGAEADDDEAEAMDIMPMNATEEPRREWTKRESTKAMDAAIRSATDRNGGFSYSDFAERIGRAPK